MKTMKLSAVNHKKHTGRIRDELLFPGLLIDPEAVSERIRVFLADQTRAHHTDGILLGLSGGVDSAVAAALAVRAVGSDRVSALHLPDKESQPKFRKYAGSLASALNIRMDTFDITSRVEEAFVRKRLRSGGESGRELIRRRAAAAGYTLLLHSSLLRRAIWHTGLAHSGIGKKISGSLGNPVVGSFYIKHIVRREILEEFAGAHNLLPVGAANRSEWLTGWFVQNGIDDLPVEPLKDLYKTQVYQLAEYLSLPAEIIAEPPSPDMFGGFSDEELMGVSWETVDRVLYSLAHNLDNAVLLSGGISIKTVRKIRRRHELTFDKRAGAHLFPEIAQPGSPSPRSHLPA